MVRFFYPPNWSYDPTYNYYRGPLCGSYGLKPGVKTYSTNNYSNPPQNQREV